MVMWWISRLRDSWRRTSSGILDTSSSSRRMTPRSASMAASSYLLPVSMSASRSTAAPTSCFNTLA